jgi:nucleoside-diphosphate-sugar epimerase
MNLSFYKNKTILVTGASGFIGSALVKKLKETSCKIIVPDGKTDIRHKKIWKSLMRKTNIFFHLAAQTSSKFANENPLKDIEINLLPVVNIIETCQKENFSPDIIFAGTVTQVGLTKNYPVNETFSDQPITVYDIDKLAAEKYLQYYSRNLGKRAVTLRLANVYGPGPSSSSADRGILNFFIRQSLKKKPITIYGPGSYIRDYIYIDDVINAFLIAAEKIKITNGNYYLIGSGKGHSIKEMVDIVKDEIIMRTGKKAKVNNVPLPKNLPPIEFRNFIADSTAFKKATGWKANISLKEGIKRTVEHYLKDKKS